MRARVPIVYRAVLGALVALASVGCASAATSSASGTSATRASKPACAAQPPAPYFEFQVEHPVRVEGPAPAGAPVPEGQRRQAFVTQFVVTPAATVDSSTFKLLDPSRMIVGADGGRRYTPVTDTALVRMAWQHVGAQRFRAAEIRGCTVPQLVQQPLRLPISAATSAP